MFSQQDNFSDLNNLSSEPTERKYPSNTILESSDAFNHPLAKRLLQTINKPQLQSKSPIERLQRAARSRESKSKSSGGVVQNYNQDLKKQKQIGRFSNQQLMAHIVKRHRETQERVQQLREEQEKKKMEEIRQVPKVQQYSQQINVNKRNLYNPAKVQGNQNTLNFSNTKEYTDTETLEAQKSDRHNDIQIQEAYTQANKFQISNQQYKPSQNDQVEQQESLQIQNSNNNQQEEDDIFKALIEQRKTYFKAQQLHFPQTYRYQEQNQLQSKTPECYVNLKSNITAPISNYSQRYTNSKQDKPHYTLNKANDSKEIGKLGQPSLLKVVQERIEQQNQNSVIEQTKKQKIIDWKQAKILKSSDNESEELQEATQEQQSQEEEDQDQRDYVIKVATRTNKWLDKKMEKIRNQVEQREKVELSQCTFKPVTNKKVISQSNFGSPRYFSQQSNYIDLFIKRRNYSPQASLRKSENENSNVINQLSNLMSGKLMPERIQMLRQYTLKNKKLPQETYKQNEQQKQIIQNSWEFTSRSSEGLSSISQLKSQKVIKAKKGTGNKKVFSAYKPIITPQYSQLTPQHQKYSFPVGFDMKSFLSRAQPVQPYNTEKLQSLQLIFNLHTKRIKKYNPNQQVNY